jgi:hypothetical protein
MPRSWNTLPKKEKDAIAEVCEEHMNAVMAKKMAELTERIMRSVLDVYMKINCKVLHDSSGWGESRLMCHIGNYYHVFEKLFEQIKTGEPIEYLDEEMRKIFKKSGYPDEFFRSLFQDWDIDTNKKEGK